MKEKGLSMLTEAEIKSRLTSSVFGCTCICYDETDSTNARAKEVAGKGGTHGTLICAEKQTDGKGRRGRVWHSPRGESIYMSLLLRPFLQPENASMLTLVMGLAAARACNEALLEKAVHKDCRVQLKWPNDLVIDGRKTAGILTEMCMESGDIRYVIIGIGINVNGKEFPKELARTAGSLYLAAGREFDRAQLVARCMHWFEKYYEIFMATEDLSVLKRDYECLLVNRGRTVRVLEPGGEYMGTALGIDERGRLLVDREDGSRTAVYAGEVSVRGVYGYI